MTGIAFLSPTGTSQKSIPLPSFVAEQGKAIGPLHYAINAELANHRIGTASSKGRSLVRGSGVKPWRQKGTGRARAGSRQSPIWRGGGVVFGPHPRSYRINLPRKQRVGALCSALCQKVQEKKLYIIDSLDIAEPKTKLLHQQVSLYMRALHVDAKKHHKVLVILANDDENTHTIRRAGKNIPYLTIQQHNRISLHTLFYSDYIFMYRKAMTNISSAVEKVFHHNKKETDSV